MDHNILNKQKITQLIKLILTCYVQLKIPIGCYEKFYWKNITWNNFNSLAISMEEIENKSYTTYFKILFFLMFNGH
jgi:hypothetical protein